ncbi:hypothetical protein ACTD5D_28645 [Nocardia takedensis]|uniref:hypothetical protein n=1 Tax=Nocardia takedensis TaxID=259390 RepID=UPI0012F70069
MTASVRTQPPHRVTEAHGAPRRRAKGTAAGYAGCPETGEQRWRHYGRMDLPVEYDRVTGRILLDGGDARICTLVMPSWLGVRVVMSGVAPGGPVVYHEPSRTCAFLTGPPRWADHLCVDASTGLGLGIGGVCVLPSPADEVHEVRRWLIPPRDGYVPPMHLVLSAVRGAYR